MVTESRFIPDYATAPGEIIEEVLDAKGINKSELATRLGLSTKTISLIISGKAPVTPETAIQLERILGISSNTWNNLEANYRLFLAKTQDNTDLEKQTAWMETFPFSEMADKGWIPRSDVPAEKVSILLNYFGVGSVSSWQEQYGNLWVHLRRSNKYKPTPEALAAWIRKGEIRAANVETSSYNKGKMDSALAQIRILSCQEPKGFEPKMKLLLANAGVALVFVSELKDTHLCGATQWLTPEKAMIALSLRYKTDDHLWFTFFHEAGHIKLHSKKMSFIDGEDLSNEDGQESEADLFASDHLIPRKLYSNFLAKHDFSVNSIREFAGELGIAPGIIIGRLQHDEHIGWGDKLNYLKCHFQLNEQDE